jgi:predicted kinase
MEMTLLDPLMKAVVMVGAPGAGKSFYAAKLAKKESAVVISGDEIRAELYGNASIQGQWNEIWERIEEMVSESVGKTVILDGTHCRAAYRKESIALLQSYGYNEIEAVVLDAPLDKCIMQNATRQRGVPRHVIVEMHENLRHSIEGIDKEGFSSISYIR